MSGKIKTVVDLPAGSWVYGFAYSTPVGLGWQQVGPGGELTWDVTSADLAPGQHRLVILDVDGEVLGLSSFTIEGAATTEDGGLSALPNTGSAETQLIAYGALVALMLGVMMVVGSTIVSRQRMVKATI